MGASLGWLITLSGQYAGHEDEAVDSRLEVSDGVGDLLPQLGVNVAGEGVGEGSDDEDIGESDPLTDNEGLAEEDLLEDIESGHDTVDSGVVGWLCVWDLVGEKLVGKDVS